MRIQLLMKGVLALAMAKRCYADISWTSVGCDSIVIKTYSMGTIWDNALSMTTNAVDQIADVTDASVIVPLTATSRMADNLKYMFGSNFKFNGALDSTSTSNLATVSGIYDGIVSLLSSNNGYVFCGGGDLEWSSELTDFTNGVWYYPLPDTTDNQVLVFSFTAGSGSENNRPCTDGSTIGRAFTALQYQSVAGVDIIPTEIKAFLLCTNQLPSAMQGTLSEGYTTSDSKPNPDDYRSVSGTIIHEMMHLLSNSYYDKESADFPDDADIGQVAYYAARCGYLALKDIASAITNPDNYRIFAEMAFSPSTRWGAPPLNAVS
ncbi:hypothetical protein BX600DRAFT_511414 [Xylariales sp. PMI_506]|nr:hypothetical protein BX600DRAFT_511414 [Xylariales sp. PMI_506]